MKATQIWTTTYKNYYTHTYHKTETNTIKLSPNTTKKNSTLPHKTSQITTAKKIKIKMKNNATKTIPLNQQKKPNTTTYNKKNTKKNNTITTLTSTHLKKTTNKTSSTKSQKQYKNNYKTHQYHTSHKNI